MSIFSRLKHKAISCFFKTRPMRWSYFLLIPILFFGFIFLTNVLQAGEARYIYDDLGRLSQVIDQNGEVATYTYDAVGNLLSITRSTGGGPAPTITALMPTSGAAGTTVAR